MSDKKFPFFDFFPNSGDNKLKPEIKYFIKAPGSTLRREIGIGGDLR